MKKIYIAVDIKEKQENEELFLEKLKEDILKETENIVIIKKHTDNTFQEVESFESNIFIGIKITIENVETLNAYTNEESIMSNGLAKLLYNNIKKGNDIKEGRVIYLNKKTSKNIICKLSIPATVVDIKIIKQETKSNISKNIATAIKKFENIKFC